MRQIIDHSLLHGHKQKTAQGLPMSIASMKSHSAFHFKKEPTLEQNVRRIFERLSNIAQRHFNVDMSYSFLEENHDEFINLQRQLTQQGTIKMAPETHLFSVTVENEIVGLAKAEGSLSKADVEKLKKMIELIVEPTLSSVRELASLETLEQKLTLILPQENVIPIRRPSQGTKPLMGTINLGTIDFTNSLPPRDEEKSVIFAELQKDLRFKKACDFHEKSSNYAFLWVTDLSEYTFSSLDEFISMGNISIYIEDVKELSTFQQSFLGHYLNSFPKSNSPQLLFGISDLTNLSNETSQIHPDLLPHLQWSSVNCGMTPLWH